MNREIAIDEALANKKTMIHELVGLFLDIDEDHDNSLSWDELQERFQDERIKAYFMSLDLDSGSVGKIFDIIDEDGSGTVELDEFVLGCMSYRGTAKAVDICILQHENTLLMQKLDDMADSISSM